MVAVAYELASSHSVKYIVRYIETSRRSSICSEDMLIGLVADVAPVSARGLRAAASSDPAKFASRFFRLLDRWPASWLRADEDARAALGRNLSGQRRHHLPDAPAIGGRGPHRGGGAGRQARFQHHRGGPARACASRMTSSSASGGARRCGTNGAGRSIPRCRKSCVRPSA